MARPDGSSEQRAKALIKFLRVDAFEFYYKRLALNGRLSDEGIKFVVVRKTLRV